MQLMDVVDTGTEPRRQGVAVQLAIVSQGEELLSGETVDTNSAWLAERCAELGHPVRRMVTAGDSIEDICWALQAAADAADVVLCTGGIGPTCDDLTAQAVAEWCDAELERRDDALELIKARYAAWDRPMDPANTKQADLPAGAQLLPNARGTAPGFSIINGATTLFCMPGVPFEMREMFQIRVQPALAQLGEASPPIIHRIRTIGRSESHLQSLLGSMELSPATLGFQSKTPEVIVKLSFPAHGELQLRQSILQQAITQIGTGVYSVDGGDLAAILGERLVARSETIALAESCTAGQIASWIGSVPGASRYLIEGAVVYANAAKIRSCGVRPEDIAAHGAVSEPVARQLAEGIRERAQTTWGLGITGIAGPSGGTEDKPVGTVHIAVAGPDCTIHRRLRVPGDRVQITARATGLAIGLLLEQLG
jgi:nicotinamide-nucleotide amidase